MKSLIDQYVENNCFGKLLGMNFEVKTPGEVHYHLKITKEHLATPLAAHGGVIAALMDALLGVGALSVSSADKKVVSTIEFKLNFLNPALVNDELLGISKTEQKGNRLIIMSGEIICPARNNAVIAKGMGTFNAYPAEKAGYEV